MKREFLCKLEVIVSNEGEVSVHMEGTHTTVRAAILSLIDSLAQHEGITAVEITHEMAEVAELRERLEDVAEKVLGDMLKQAPETKDGPATKTN